MYITFATDCAELQYNIMIYKHTANTALELTCPAMMYQRGISAHS